MSKFVPSRREPVEGFERCLNSGEIRSHDEPAVERLFRACRRSSGEKPSRAQSLSVRFTDVMGIVALNVGDVATVREGLVVRVRRSKGDQEGKGAEKGIPYASNASICPVRALAAWLAATQITEGSIFRAIDQHGHVSAAALNDKSVSLIVKRAAKRAGA